MTWSNYHTHTRFSDGVGEPRDFVEAALSRGLAALGFSEHAPLPFPTGWTTPTESVSEYISLIHRLRGEFAGRLEVYCGMEFDYIPGKAGLRYNPPFAAQLDYTLGAVHYVGEFDIGNQWQIDGSDAAKFSRGLVDIYGGDIRAAVRHYYQLVREMLADKPPTILAHLDLIRMNLGRFFSDWFSTDESWYRREVETTLEAVKAAGVILEVNTGGIARGKADDFYPQKWVLKRACQMGLPVLVGADAHQPEFLTGMFAEAFARLLEVGCRKVRILRGDEWREEEIAEMLA